MAEKKNVIRELIETGKRNGKLTTKEINDAIEESGFDVEQIDKLYETMEGHGIEIVEGPTRGRDLYPDRRERGFIRERPVGGGRCHRRPCKGVFERDWPGAPAEQRRGDPACTGHSGRGRGAGKAHRPVPEICRIEADQALSVVERKEQMEQARAALTREQLAELGRLDTTARRGERKTAPFRRPTCGWWCRSPSGMWAAGCSSWT